MKIENCIQSGEGDEEQRSVCYVTTGHFSAVTWHTHGSRLRTSLK